MIDQVEDDLDKPYISAAFLSMLDARSDWLTISTLIREGIASSFFDDMGYLIGLSPAALGRLLEIKASKRQRWKKLGFLNPTDGDYLYRQAIALNNALGLFEGNRLATCEWLTSPAAALGHKTPAELLSTFVGIDLVEAFIWRIEHGVTA